MRQVITALALFVYFAAAVMCLAIRMGTLIKVWEVQSMTANPSTSVKADGGSDGAIHAHNRAGQIGLRIDIILPT